MSIPGPEVCSTADCIDKYAILGNFVKTAAWFMLFVFLRPLANRLSPQPVIDGDNGHDKMLEDLVQFDQVFKGEVSDIAVAELPDEESEMTDFR